MAPVTPSNHGAKEVDFYHNPTELFRWINYRRWDGALNRAQAAPEEVSTWIVSKDSGGTHVVWRHLPIHLCCMQSSIPYALVETLLRIDPDSASYPDHEGLIPLHLACLKGGITERVASLLLLYDPAGVCTTDNQNRTPLDLLQKTTSKVTGDKSDSKRAAALRTMIHVQNRLNRLKQTVREDEVARLDAVTKSASNERIAAQQQIMNLEKRLEEAESRVKLLESEVDVKNELENDFGVKIVSLQKQLDHDREEKESHVAEIRKLKEENALKEEVLNKHGDVVSGVKHEANRENARLKKQVEDLQSQVATARAMTEAVETQLKEKFTEEHRASVEVQQLQSSLKDVKASLAKQERKTRDQVSALRQENSDLKETMEDITEENLILQSKVKELSDCVSNLLASQNILSAEQDRLMETAERNERNLIECMQGERAKLLKIIEKQRKFLEESFVEQSRAIESAEKTEKKLQSTVATERERTLLAIKNVKKVFREAETDDRERKGLVPLEERKSNGVDPVPQRSDALAITLPQHNIRSPGSGDATNAVSAKHGDGVSSPTFQPNDDDVPLNPLGGPSNNFSSLPHGGVTRIPSSLGLKQPQHTPKGTANGNTLSRIPERRQLNNNRSPKKSTRTAKGGRTETPASVGTNSNSERTPLYSSSTGNISPSLSITFSSNSSSESSVTEPVLVRKKQSSRRKAVPHASPKGGRSAFRTPFDTGGVGGGGQFMKLEDVGQTLLSNNSQRTRPQSTSPAGKRMEQRQDETAIRNGEQANLSHF